MKIQNSSRSNQGNLLAVMRYLRINGAQSNADLARVFAVPAGTTARYIARLKELELIRKVTAKSTEDKSVGKPPILYEVNPVAGSILTVEVNKRKVVISCCDFAGKIVFSDEYKALKEEALVEQVKDLISEQLANWATDIPAPACVVCGVSASVSRDNIVNGSIFPKNLNLSEVLNSVINIPVIVENDANLAVIGEKNFGIVKKASDVICILDSYDFGIGLFINGKLFKGFHGRAGEATVADLLLGAKEPINLADGLKLEQSFDDGVEFDLSDHAGVYRSLGEFATCGDNNAVLVLDRIASKLLDQSIRLIRLIDPEKLVISGDVVQAGKYFFEIFFTKLKQLHVKSSTDFELEQIVFSEFTGNVVSTGAGAVGIDKHICDLTQRK